jgi:flagellar biosynthesis chaperone FliJ
MVKAANLHRLESLERRIGKRSLEHEAMAYQKLLERLESAIRQIAKMNGEDPEAAVEAHRAKQGGTIREQVEAYIEELRQGGPTIREQVEVYIEERQERHQAVDSIQKP